jgi:hypothetical protein
MRALSRKSLFPYVNRETDSRITLVYLAPFGLPGKRLQLAGQTRTRTPAPYFRDRAERPMPSSFIRRQSVTRLTPRLFAARARLPEARSSAR